MASPGRPHRRNSIILPPSMSSEINQLNEELNRLYEDVAPQIQQHIKNVKNITNGSKIYYQGAVILVIMAVVLGLALLLYDPDNDDPVLDFVFVVAIFFVAFGFVFAIRLFERKWEEMKLRAVDEEHKVYLDNTKSLFDLLERVCQRTDKVLRDFMLLVSNARSLHERFAAFETVHFFQRVDYVEDDKMSKFVHLSRNLSEMIRKVTSVSDILKDISEDNKRQKHSNRKEKTEQFVNNIHRELAQIKNAVNETRLITNRISNTLKST